MIGLVFLAFLAYIVILAWLRTRLIHVRVRYVVIMTVTTKPSSSSYLLREPFKNVLAPTPLTENQCEKKKVFFLSGKGGYPPPLTDEFR